MCRAAFIVECHKVPSKKPSITIRVNDEEYEVLKDWAEREYRTVAGLVLALTKKSIDEYKERHQNKETA
ncbi:hypothetical protein RIVM261_021970 [Rivularia sp. IAM M-261]|nr:hypothetical protein RIVM261_021970 [Rivularia sp. IAM M-261]